MKNFFIALVSFYQAIALYNSFWGEMEWRDRLEYFESKHYDWAIACGIAIALFLFWNFIFFLIKWCKNRLAAGSQ